MPDTPESRAQQTISQPLTEADTCRKYVLPKLYASGWSDDHINEQRTFTNGRIVVAGNRTIRRKQKRADYFLRYRPDFAIAIVEAKANYKKPADGLGQAKEYAEILGLKFAYSTNGHGIVEHDFTTGIEKSLEAFPSPDELWQRLKHNENIPSQIVERLLTPYYHLSGKSPRYYQEIAINNAIRAILQGHKRVLLTLATGTGKTVVAFQICYKLWSTKWNRTNDPARRPRILYLADRNILVDDPKAKIFAPFGDAAHKIEREAVKSREMYFATYQAIAKDERRPGLYRDYPKDFFDLIVVDECHRGSAADDSNWKDILKYFEPAFQLGMTATPKREDNRDTYLYFGNPLYTYSLRQGIEDGFLAPYRVHRIVTSADVGWRPDRGQTDRLGREIPDAEYTTKDFERKLSLLPRTETIARNLSDFLKANGRFDKTIVFCVDQEHAEDSKCPIKSSQARR
jgi:type I restriction enzyme R subunit